MSDVDERSLERNEELTAQLLVFSIRDCQNKAVGHELNPIGECHSGCGEKLTLPEQKFCDEECAEDWHDVIKAEQRKTGRYNPRSLISYMQ